MSYLLYCILNGRCGPARPSIKGVRGQAVWILECGDVCAAVSQTSPLPDGQYDPATPPQLEDLLDYAKAVEALGRRETMVPMRYGCGFQSVGELRTWMRRCEKHLRATLYRLDGCVEMGVRALLLETSPSTPLASRATTGAVKSGAEYLTARKAELALTQRSERVAQLVRDAMAGCFRECIAEAGFAHTRPMASIYFLVERSRLGAFRQAFSSLNVADAALMLSGPWPPYNFVCGPAGDDLDLTQALR